MIFFISLLLSLWCCTDLGWNKPAAWKHSTTWRMWFRARVMVQLWIRRFSSLQHVVCSVLRLTVATVVLNNAEPLALSHTLLSPCFLQRNNAERNPALSVYTRLVLLEIVSVCRCAAAAVSPVAPCQADSLRRPAAADPLEMIPSSQGSPIISPAKLVPAQLVDSKNHSDPEGNVATPASGVKSASCWVLNVLLELIYFYKNENEWKRLHFKKCCLFGRFAPSCSELCLQTLTVRLPRSLFWHAVVMKRRERRTTTEEEEALDSNVTTRHL